MKALLTVFLVGSCAMQTGDYCTVYEPVRFAQREVAAYVVTNDRPAAETIELNNRSYAACP